MPIKIIPATTTSNVMDIKKIIEDNDGSNSNIDIDTLEKVSSEFLIRQSTAVERINAITNRYQTAFLVKKPTILLPVANSINILDNTLVGNEYAAINNYVGGHDATIWHIATDVNFSNLIEDVTVNNKTIYKTNKLKNNTTYYVRLMYISDNHVSEWSDTIEFTTGELITIETPNIIVENGPNKVPITPIITTSGFIVNNGEETHVSTDWIIVDNTNIVTYQSLNDVDNLITIQIPNNILEYNKLYTVKVKYNSTTLSSNENTYLFKVVNTPYIKTPELSIQGYPTSISTAPTLFGSEFIPVNNIDKHIATHWKIYDGNNVLIWDKYVDGGVLRYITVPDKILNLNTTYQFNVMYIGEEYVSEWSIINGTVSVNVYIETPVITADGSSNITQTPINLTPLLEGSEFSVNNGVDAHVETMWTIKNVDTGLENSITTTGNELTEFLLPSGYITEYDALYTISAVYKGITYTSDVSKITIRTQLETNIITPTISAKLTNGRMGVNPSLTTSAFTTENPVNGDTHVSTEWAVYDLSVSSTNPIHTYVDNDSNLTELTIPVADTLEYNKQYKITAKHIGAAYSSLIGSVTFWTIEEVQINQPVITYNGNSNSIVVNSKRPTFVAGPIVVTNGTVTLGYTDWEILKNGVSVFTETIDNITESTTSTLYIGDLGLLDYGESYIVRAKFYANEDDTITSTYGEMPFSVMSEPTVSMPDIHIRESDGVISTLPTITLDAVPNITPLTIEDIDGYFDHINYKIYNQDTGSQILNTDVSLNSQINPSINDFNYIVTSINELDNDTEYRIEAVVHAMDAYGNVAEFGSSIGGTEIVSPTDIKYVTTTNIPIINPPTVTLFSGSVNEAPTNPTFNVTYNAEPGITYVKTNWTILDISTGYTTDILKDDNNINTLAVLDYTFENDKTYTIGAQHFGTFNANNIESDLGTLNITIMPPADLPAPTNISITEIGSDIKIETDYDATPIPDNYSHTSTKYVITDLNTNGVLLDSGFITASSQLLNYTSIGFLDGILEFPKEINITVTYKFHNTDNDTYDSTKASNTAILEGPPVFNWKPFSASLSIAVSNSNLAFMPGSATQIMLAGGSTTGHVLDSTDQTQIIDLSTGQVSALLSNRMLIPIADHALVSDSSKVVLLGGFRQDTSINPNMYIYENSGWTLVDHTAFDTDSEHLDWRDNPTATFDGLLLRDNHTMAFFGGQTSDLASSDKIYLYKYGSNSQHGLYLSPVRLPMALHGHRVVRINNAVYLYGGATKATSGSSAIENYTTYKASINTDGSLGNFYSVNSNNTHPAASRGGELLGVNAISYVGEDFLVYLGGLTDIGGSNTVITDVEVFPYASSNTLNRQWMMGTDYSHARIPNLNAGVGSPSIAHRITSSNGQYVLQILKIGGFTTYGVQCTTQIEYVNVILE